MTSSQAGYGYFVQAITIREGDEEEGSNGEEVAETRIMAIWCLALLCHHESLLEETDLANALLQDEDLGEALSSFLLPQEDDKGRIRSFSRAMLAEAASVLLSHLKIDGKRELRSVVVRDWLQHERPENRTAAVLLLGSLLSGPSEEEEQWERETAWNALLGTLDDCHPPVRRELLSAIRDQHTETLLALSNDPSPTVSEDAINREYTSRCAPNAAKAYAVGQAQRRLAQLRRHDNAVNARLRRAQLVQSQEARRWILRKEREFDQVSCLKALSHKAGAVTASLFHPLEELLLTATEDGTVAIHDYQSNTLRNSIQVKGRVTGLACVDWEPVKLLVSTTDGLIRLYRHFESASGTTELVAAWSMGNGPPSSPSPSSPSSSLLMEWNQFQRRLFTVPAGPLHSLAVLDAAREQIVQRIPLLVDSPATAITSDRREMPLISLGFGDGSLRLYDLRSNSPIACLNSSTSSVIVLKQQVGSPQLLVGHGDGSICRWDTRQQRILHQFSSIQSHPPHSPQILEHLEIHEHTPLLACSHRSVVRLYDTASGSMVGGDLKRHRSSFSLFNEHPPGLVSALTMHPRRLLLAVGHVDGTTALYAPTLI